MEDLNKAFNRQFLIPKGHFQGAELKSMEGKLWTNPEMPKLIKSFIRQREKELLEEIENLEMELRTQAELSNE